MHASQKENTGLVSARLAGDGLRINTNRDDREFGGDAIWVQPAQRLAVMVGNGHNPVEGQTDAGLVARHLARLTPPAIPHERVGSALSEPAGDKVHRVMLVQHETRLATAAVGG